MSLGAAPGLPAAARRATWSFALLSAAALCLPVALAPGPIFNPGGVSLLLRFLGAALHPACDGASLALAARAALRTLEYAVCGSALSLAVGAPLGVLCADVFWREVAARRAGRPPLRGLPSWGVRFAAAVPRGAHEIVWGLLLVAILGVTPMSAVLALGLPFGLITARVFADTLDATPRGPMRVLRDAGVRPTVAFVYGLVPQALPQLLAYALYRLECGLRSAVILGLVGAGGLGFEIQLSLQSLRYGEVWLFLYALGALVAGVDAWSGVLNRRLRVSVLAGAVRVEDRAAPPAAQCPVLRRSLLGFGLLLCVSLADVDVLGALARAASGEPWRRLVVLARAAWPPRFDLAQAWELGGATLQTLRMSVLAMFIAALGGWLLSFPAAACLVPRAGSRRRTALGVLLFTRAVLTLARAFSEGLWVLVLLFTMFPGELPGALALGCYNGAVLARLMAHVHDTGDVRVLDALRAQGAPLPCAVAYSLVPAGLARCAGYVLYRWEVCARATAVVGVMGAGGLGRRLEERLAAFDYAGVSAALVFYVGLTLGVDVIGGWARRALAAR